MNSRDAAYEAQLQELLVTTAAEAGASVDETGEKTNGVAKSDDAAEEVIVEVGPSGRKKRKRADDEGYEASLCVSFQPRLPSCFLFLRTGQR